MQKINHNLFPFYRFQSLTAFPGLLHFVSSGVKSVGFGEHIDPGLIRQHRKELAMGVGFDPGWWVCANQIHSAHVAIITDEDRGRGAMDRESRVPNTDALVTNVENICLMVLSADCVPILLYDPEMRVIAAVHAGWRGTAAAIVADTVAVMQRQFHCRPAAIRAAIGPSIGKCCFEVSEDVAAVFKDLFSDHKEIVTSADTPGKYKVDLWEANRQELMQAGVISGHIEVAGMCTVCHRDRFFSYRRDAEAAGRFGAGIMLQNVPFV